MWFYVLQKLSTMTGKLKRTKLMLWGCGTLKFQYAFMQVRFDETRCFGHLLVGGIPSSHQLASCFLCLGMERGMLLSVRVCRRLWTGMVDNKITIYCFMDMQSPSPMRISTPKSVDVEMPPLRRCSIGMLYGNNVHPRQGIRTQQRLGLR